MNTCTCGHSRRDHVIEFDGLPFSSTWCAGGMTETVWFANGLGPTRVPICRCVGFEPVRAVLAE